MPPKWGYWEEKYFPKANKEEISKCKKQIEGIVKRYLDKYVVCIDYVSKDHNNVEFGRSNIFVLKFIDKVIEYPHNGNVFILSIYEKKALQAGVPFTTNHKEKNKLFVEWLNFSLEKNGKKWKKHDNSRDGKYGYCEAKKLKKDLLEEIVFSGYQDTVTE